MIDSRAWLKSAAALLLCAAAPARADDGYRLWLRYDPVQAPLRSSYAAGATELVLHARGATAEAAASELERALPALLGTFVPVRSRVVHDGAILVALAGSPELQPLHLRTKDLGSEGFLIRSARV